MKLLDEVAAADPAKLPTSYPERLAKALPKAHVLSSTASRGGSDLGSTCAAIDELMAKFRK